jgi:hypothetical protein
MTAALDSLYIGWIPIVFLMGCVVAWLPGRGQRTRALCCWGLVWVGLGTVLAQLFSSAGPVYYHHLVPGPDPYAPLLAHLDSVNAALPLSALSLQADIWANHLRVHDLPWLHISAFPSLHVALPMFFGVVMWRVWRPLSVLLLGLTVLILCGSIYLAWHYALDGYVSILGVLACWWLAGRVRRYGLTRSRSRTAAPIPTPHCPS